MFNVKLLVYLSVFSFAACVNSGNGPSTTESFKQCLISQPVGSFGYCLGVGAISKLQSWDNSPEFDLVDGITVTKDEERDYREGYNVLESNPNDFRSIVDSFGQVFARRSMKWEMDWMYPGLMLRVAPSTSPGGQLEFILDPHREVVNQHSLKEASTGRILTRQFLVPLLLGFKFNIVTIIPIVFGLLALIAKKAVFLSKIALVASSALGLGSLLFNGGGAGGYGGYYGHKPTYGHYGQHGLGAHGYRFPEEEYSENLYEVRGTSGRDMDYNNQPIAEDQLRFVNFKRSQHLNNKAATSEEVPIKNKRNFAWDEKEMKTKQ